MKVHFFATLRPIVGGKTVEFDTDHGLTVQEMLGVMIARFPKLKAELLDETGKMHGHVHFFVNGRDAQFLENGIETRILPDDVVNVFPAVGGG
ncbi:MAG: MoaD family protein [Thermoflexales bacterium]|nr:MoaD family protein [Thermoflexales bacterium]